jgi:hypothetical protein
MGHSSITITLDRYGHLMPGNRRRRRRSSTPTSSGANTQARVAQARTVRQVARQCAPETGGLQRITADNETTAE